MVSDAAVTEGDDAVVGPWPAPAAGPPSGATEPERSTEEEGDDEDDEPPGAVCESADGFAGAHPTNHPPTTNNHKPGRDSRSQQTVPSRALARRLINKLPLPSEVSESLVGIGHAVSIFPLGDRRPFLAVGGQDFIGQLQMSRPPLLLADGP